MTLSDDLSIAGLTFALGNDLLISVLDWEHKDNGEGRPGNPGEALKESEATGSTPSTGLHSGPS
jgi:hypothetical protein